MICLIIHHIMNVKYVDGACTQVYLGMRNGTTSVGVDNAKLQFHMCWWLLFTEFTPFLRVYCYMIKRSACFHICPCLLKYSGTYAKWYLLLTRIHRRSISNLVFKMHLISLMHWVLKWIKYCPMDVIMCLAA